MEESQLVEVGVLGDYSESMGFRICPDIYIIAFAEAESTNMG